MNQLDKIKEILELAQDTTGETEWDDDNLEKIQRICEKIILDEKVNKRLQNT